MKITMTNGTRFDSIDDLLDSYPNAAGVDSYGFAVDLGDEDALAEALRECSEGRRVLVYEEDLEIGSDDAIGDITPTVRASMVDEPDYEASPYGHGDPGESL